jgi:IS30 family transposase
VTLVERQSRYTLFVKIDGKDTSSVVSALITHVRTLPCALPRSLTWDRGMEWPDTKNLLSQQMYKFTSVIHKALGKRGTNENTNRLLRQYFPKGTVLSGYSQTDLNKVALQLNQRPRKTLGYYSPADKLQVLLH